MRQRRRPHAARGMALVAVLWIVAALSLLVASVVIFLLIVMVPGDPATFMLGTGAQPDTLAALRALPGIGDWTAELVALRVLAWPDAFPASDIGVRRALGAADAASAAAQAQAWQPWRSYAVMQLWQSAAA